MNNWREYQTANRPRQGNADLYVMWLMIVFIAALLSTTAAPPAIVPRLQCIRCHYPAPLPIIRSGAQYGRIHSGKPKTADDMRAVRELKEQEYIISQLLANPQH